MLVDLEERDIKIMKFHASWEFELLCYSSYTAHNLELAKVSVSQFLDVIVLETEIL